MTLKLLLSWSSGKDSAWALHVLRQQGNFQVCGLVTTFNQAFNRVAMHGVRRELVDAQAAATGIPLWPVFLPWPCSNDEYECQMRALIEQARARNITHMAFGDLFLEDVRAYREGQLAGTGITPVFPLWGTPADTPDLARQMIDAGLMAVLTCIDPRQLAPAFAGRPFDTQLLNELPAGVDPCGEKGEFHTFCHHGPMFTAPIPVQAGPVVERDGFWFADISQEQPGMPATLP
jgi:uncharacterized protein (TIGR00290 family)